MNSKTVIILLLFLSIINAFRISEYCVFNDIESSCIELKRPVDIIYVNEITECDAIGAEGCAIFSNRTIILRDISVSENRMIIWHEMMHFYLYEIGISCGNETVFDSCKEHHTLIKEKESAFLNIYTSKIGLFNYINWLLANFISIILKVL